MRGSKPAIVDYMIAHNGITSMDAFKHLGITRLSARIKELRDMGMNIETIMIEGKTRYSESCRYALYVYRGNDDGIEAEGNKNNSGR